MKLKRAARRSLVGLIAAALVTPSLPLLGQELPLPAEVSFNRDIRPLLSENCFFCHGPDEAKREGGLRLDTLEGLVGQDSDSVGTVVPGDPDSSELIRRIRSRDESEIMPPPDSHKSLTTQQIELLERWVRQGAEYEGHWSFQPLRHPELPLGSASQNPLDTFIEQTRARQGLTSAPPADRVTLVRRLHLDLWGLPPTPEQAAEFLNDESPAAYEALVDRLLAAPHFGERMALWWLDLVRYADTVGYHGDQSVSVSPFRDYVIDSFNNNKPFDQFTIEQLAGDLLPEPTREQLIGSGYNRLGMMSAEGGVQDREYLAKYNAERVRNASGTWLGITLGCAECHDHKYDPFSARDFYRFAAFFADIKERGLYAGANDDGNWGPYLKVPTASEAQQLREMEQEIAAVRATLESSPPELLADQAIWEEQQVTWHVLSPTKVESQAGVSLNLQADGSWLASGVNPDRDTYTLTFRAIPTGVTAWRLDVLPDDSLPRRGPGRAGNGNFVLSEFRVSTIGPEQKTQQIALQNPTASYEQTGASSGNPYGKWAIAAAVDEDVQGAKWGWAVMEQVGQSHVAIFETTADLTLEPGQELQVQLEQNLDNPQHTIGRFRVAVATAPRPLTATTALPWEVAHSVAKPRGARSDAEQTLIDRHYRQIAPRWEPLRVRLAELERARTQLEKSIRSTLITETVPPRPIRVLARGNWMDETGEEVTPGYPVVLTTDNTPSNPSAADERLTRYDLAQWLVSRENPLTARVTVNRVWKLFFGAGLSRTLDDVGAQGEWPSHPELLDWLAADFRDHGWDVKRLVKTIVMSETYRQSSQGTPALREFDPYNRWLARQGRFRLEAELIRDNALAISGLLNPTVGGRSVFPYQPAGYWAYLNFPTREWQNSSGPELYRRGLYTHWQRQYLHPSLMAFDAPSREECTADRPRSNTPLQSLVLLNDPTYVEAARALAESLMQRPEGDFHDRLNDAFWRALARPATAEETAVLSELWQATREDFAAHPDTALALLRVGERPSPPGVDAAELGAWISVARVILNLHEVVTRN